MSDHMADVLIVGGGVMGCAAAYHLARMDGAWCCSNSSLSGTTEYDIARFRLDRPALSIG
jgi:glycine/D-amino acid oxidase-like deaminating enzyme